METKQVDWLVKDKKIMLMSPEGMVKAVVKYYQGDVLMLNILPNSELPSPERVLFKKGEKDD